MVAAMSFNSDAAALAAGRSAPSRATRRHTPRAIRTACPSGHRPHPMRGAVPLPQRRSDLERARATRSLVQANAPTCSPLDTLARRFQLTVDPVYLGLYDPVYLAKCAALCAVPDHYLARSCTPRSASYECPVRCSAHVRRPSQGPPLPEGRTSGGAYLIRF
jgi:hypothetical protein